MTFCKEKKSPFEIEIHEDSISEMNVAKNFAVEFSMHVSLYES